MFIYSSALPMSWSFNLSSTKKLQSLIWIETSVGVKYVALNDRAQKRKSNVILLIVLVWIREVIVWIRFF